MELLNKVAIVTGAARGIGFEIAQCFVEDGASVILVDRSGAEAAAARLASRGFDATGSALDITDMEAVRAAVADIVAKKGKVDILVNNAGIIARGSLTDLSREQWLSVMDVNVNGNFYLCKAVIPYMIRQGGGNILNITSIAAKMGDITAAPVYGASKGAIDTLTKSLARQLASHGIRVNAVAPHAIDTDMSAQWSEEKRRAVVDAIPLGRMGTAREVAEAALFLVSEKAAFITGETLNVNGGYLMD
jgi:3-oxoacyl-[acyl-carrier protein] reductase